jgi:nucleotide-binding universal stress UspA family protein
MRNILLPTDFSDNAYDALTYAVRLYGQEDCTFFLLHTYAPPISRPEYLLDGPAQIGLGDTYRTASLENLERTKETAIGEFGNPGHTFEVRSAFNTLVDETLETVRDLQIDLIVMGTQGAAGAKEILLGTNTVDVIKKVPCPVIAVPSNFRYRAPKNILFPTDFEIDYREARLGPLWHLAKEHASKIDVLHVSASYDLDPGKKANRSSLGELLTGIDHEYHDVPDTGIIGAITEFQSGEGTDLLAMARNRHSFLERLFIEPVIEKIGFHTSIPFMVFPYRAVSGKEDKG